MSLEIERKFLVVGEFKHLSHKSYRITQGYISSSPFPTVRVRIKDEKAYITIKGKSTNNGLTRYEWEKEIPLNEANELMALCTSPIIDKIRYEVEFDNKIFEVDEFLCANEGLLIAELELEYEDQNFLLPDWLGTELTGDRRYYNSYLSHHPYSGWEH